MVDNNKRLGGRYYDGPCIVIVGPTGSGKTGVAIEIAKELSGRAEIISADSRAIYKYMDIGTAKPSREEREEVVHFGLDLVEPGERFTVADWKKMAEQKIVEIRNRGHVPMIVGGTGLYIDALVYNYKFIGKTGEKAPKDGSDEQKNCSDRQNNISNFIIFGIECKMDELRTRLKQRLNKLFVQELYDETSYLVEKYGWNNQAMKSNIYEYAWLYFEKGESLDEMKEKCLVRDYRLAKRQMTWFKRNKKIIWLSLEKVKPSVLKCIQYG